MKRNILHIFWAAALLLTACTQEEIPLPDADDAEPLSITVTDGGYASTDKTATRATENGYATQFTAGDACGLFIIRDKRIIKYNARLVATAGTDGSLTWQPPAGENLTGGLPNEKYFLYYPYQADMTNKIISSATNDADFFAPLISGWQPKTDQSDYATGYTASDLMTATGSAVKTDGKLSLSFAMTHRMALAVIDCSQTIVYHFTNTTGGNIPDYTVRLSLDIDITSEAKPWHATDGSYRYIVCPMQKNATPLTGYYDGCIEDFTVTPNNLEDGRYKTFRLTGGTIEKNHNLQVGDFLLTDGSLVGKDETLTPEQQANVSAIVFWSPAETDYTEGVRQTPASLTDDKIMASDYPNCTHGLAAAVKNLTYNSKATIAWQKSSNNVESWRKGDNFIHDNKTDFASISSKWDEETGSLNKIYGYQNTVILRAYNAYYTANNKPNYIVQPVVALDEFVEANTNPAPVGSTGWYFPSAKEMHLLCNKDVDNIYSSSNKGTVTLRIVNASLSAVSGDAIGQLYEYDYWSSTESASDSYAFRIDVSDGRMGYPKKSNPNSVRPVCAF